MEKHDSKNCIYENTSAAALVQFLVDHDMIDIDDVQKRVREQTLEKIITEHHHNEIWTGKDGRWRTYVVDKNAPGNRKMIVKTRKADLYEFLYNYYTSQKKAIIRKTATLRTLYPEWLQFKSTEAAPTYISRIKRDWKAFYEEDSSIVDKPIAELDKIALQQWLNELIRNNSMTKKCYTNSATIIRNVLNYAVDLEIIRTNPLDGIRIKTNKLCRREKKPEPSTQVFNEEEVASMVELAKRDLMSNRPKKYKPHLALVFQFYTGLRIGEICALRYEDIKNGMVSVERMFRKETHEIVDHPKTDAGIRKVILPKEAEWVIEKAKEIDAEKNISPTGYVFGTGETPMMPSSAQELFKRYCKELHITYRSTHKARKTYISSLHDHGMNVDTIMRLAGHNDERTTMHNYVFDRNPESEKRLMVENALSYVNKTKKCNQV